MAWGGIVLTENPVTDYDTFHLALPRNRLANIRTTKRDMGGYWQADFDILPESREEAQVLLANCLGRHVEIHHDYGDLAWEGMVNSVVLETGTATIINSLNDMGNDVWCRYTPIGGTTVARSTVYESAMSKAKFATKQFVLGGGEIAAASADQFASLYRDWNFWPRPTLQQINTEGQVRALPGLTLKCIGYIRTFEWMVYNQTILTGTALASTVMQAIVTACGQFVASSVIGPNNTVITREYDADRHPLDIMESIASLGDSDGYTWVIGMTRGRKFYFTQATPPFRLRSG